jgi:hypothetical protein
LVWKVDRFGRSLKHLVNALADLGAYGVAFISLRDNLDLSTPSGRLMFQIDLAGLFRPWGNQSYSKLDQFMPPVSGNESSLTIARLPLQ